MAKVDCEANGQLCQEHNIRAYPTIQVYMHGENSMGAIRTRHPCSQLLVVLCVQRPPRHTTVIVQATHFLHGWDTNTRFLKLKKLRPKLLRVPKRQPCRKVVREMAREMVARPRINSTRGARRASKGVRLRVICVSSVFRCAVVYAVRPYSANRTRGLPQGNFHIQFTHDNMDYKNSLINATHLIDHLTFGDRLPLSVANMLDQIDATGPGFNTLANHDFVSIHADRTYEHFIQVLRFLAAMPFTLNQARPRRSFQPSTRHAEQAKSPSTGIR